MEKQHSILEHRAKTIRSGAATITLVAASLCGCVTSLSSGSTSLATVETEVLPGIVATLPLGSTRVPSAGIDSEVAEYRGQSFVLIFDYGRHGGIPEYSKGTQDRVRSESGVDFVLARGQGASEEYEFGFAMKEVRNQAQLTGESSSPYLTVTASCSTAHGCEDLSTRILKSISVRR